MQWHLMAPCSWTATSRHGHASTQWLCLTARVSKCRCTSHTQAQCCSPGTTMVHGYMHTHCQTPFIPSPPQIRRPSNYDAAEAAALGPTTPDPSIDLSQVAMCKTVVEDSLDKLFVGGLPWHYGDEQVREQGGCPVGTNEHRMALHLPWVHCVWVALSGTSFWRIVTTLDYSSSSQH
jgi:hypothetical protein